MEKIITSSRNSIINHIKALHSKKNRDNFGQLFIEGYRIVKDALDSNAGFEFVVVSDKTYDENINKLLADIRKKEINVYIVKHNLFKQISDTKTPQGILAVVKKQECNLNELIGSTNAFVVLLEDIQDPGNMGTVIRTADAAGITGIIVSKGSVDIYNPKVLRSTMGSIFNISVIKQENFEKLIKHLKDNAFNIYAAHAKGEKNYFDISMNSKTAIVIGNEANGIKEKTLSSCELTKIPILGKAESLNASVASSIFMYEYVRQRLG